MGDKKLLILPLLILLAGLSYVAYQASLVQNSYLGLPTAACIDDTKPIKESFTFNLKIKINGHNYPLDGSIGHDYGNCLRSIYTSDTSGTVFIRSNNTNIYTLGNFFQVWRKAFNQNQLFNHQVAFGHNLQVSVNGQNVKTFENTQITSGAQIVINYF